MCCFLFVVSCLLFVAVVAVVVCCRRCWCCRLLLVVKVFPCVVVDVALCFGLLFGVLVVVVVS